MTGSDAAVLAALEHTVQALVDRISSLEAAVAVLRLSRSDRRRLARVLPVIVAVIGSESFTTRELVQAEAAGLRLVLDGLSPEAIGRLLARAAGVPIAGLVVQRLGEEAHAAIWCVVGVA